MDCEQKKNKEPAFFHGKLRILDHLKQKVAENPGFSWTRITTRAFLDWGLRAASLADVRAHTIERYNGGNTPFSAANFSTIAKAVLAVIKNLETTKNCPLLIHDAAITQNQILRITKVADGIDWTIKEVDSKQLLKDSLDELKKANADTS